jgi:large subunit ribosomal protein L10
MPSKKALQEKEAFVTDLTAKIKKSACGVLADYKGINVADDTVLRRELRNANVEYFVVKNTLLKRALQQAGITGLDDKLEGPTALALSETDIIAAPKTLYKQVEKSEKAPMPFTFKGGFIEGQAIDASVVVEYAKLPDKATLVSKLLFILQSPMQKLAIAASEIAKKQEQPAQPAQPDAEAQEAPAAEAAAE